jgi:hypothetical protein
MFHEGHYGVRVYNGAMNLQDRDGIAPMEMLRFLLGEES